MAAHELILGGAKCGKSRTAEARATAWLAGGPARRATLVATALPGDTEMAARIARHQADRARRAPGLATVELGTGGAGLGPTLQRLADPEHLLVVDCLTLWLTQLLLPPSESPAGAGAAPDAHAETAALLGALEGLRSPVVLVSNEIGWGVMPLSPEARHFVDELGLLHQAVATRCARVTLVVAGCEWALKSPEPGTAPSGAGAGVGRASA